ncbi:MAG: 2-oxoacid:acceptor oxidoreductase family protein [Candidatus Thermoplasmatota archaeon]|nr:2-oxoacid:acceptor oxidoreductase family protein [Candidatus Thermoplasmatota archaeon]
MIEVRFHGRGGQGVVIASEVLAKAAFKMGFEVSSFPFFGVERRGAPVTAYARIDKNPIRIKSSIYEPDYIVVLDSTLLKGVDLLEGLKPGGKVLINYPDDKTLPEISDRFQYYTLDATAIAATHGIGSKMTPIVNTAIMGGFAKMSDWVSIEAMLEIIREVAPVKKDENVEAAREAYERTREVAV